MSLANIYGEADLEDGNPGNQPGQPVSSSSTTTPTGNGNAGTNTPLLGSGGAVQQPVGNSADENVEVTSSKSRCMRILSSVLVCGNECSAFYYLTAEDVQDRVSKYWIARHTFYVHWLTVMAVTLNMVLVYTFDQHLYLFKILMPLVYLFLSWTFGWHFWVAPIITQLKKASGTFGCWSHMKFGSHMIFSSLMLVGYPSWGIVGVIGFEKKPLEIINMILRFKGTFAATSNMK
uniref:Uncharacterized protein n=1 Tax=Aplanochytrium stocchinoi TaxID=215587 RepID=A0A7S3V155_9STRA